MPKYQASDVARKMIALLENARNISVKNSNRRLALDVVDSCKILCKSKNFLLDDNFFDTLTYSIKNYKPDQLSQIFDEAAEAVIEKDIEKYGRK